MYRYYQYTIPVYPPVSPYYPPVSPYYPPFRQLPPVKTEQFMKSAKTTGPLLKDAEIFLNRISSSASFSKKFMEEAQKSHTKELTKLFKQLHLKSTPTVRYNPTGIIISFTDSDAQVVLNMRW
jgi:hypothetical protein